MKVKEIFYSIQGEGRHAGRAAIFIRLSGCNLSCNFCDTEHKQGKDYTEEEIIEEAKKYAAELVIITGGEPTLQLTETLVDKLHHIGKYVAIETNGTRIVPSNVDWVTVSPKQSYVGNIGTPILAKANEVKIVIDGIHTYHDPTFGIEAEYYYIQPCDTGYVDKNRDIIEICVDFIKKNPKWALSLQTQKILNIR